MRPENAYESIRAFAETDFTEDLREFDIPTLVLHGEDDQIVPIKDSAHKSARIIKNAKELYYPGAPHGLMATHQDRVNTDPLSVLFEIDIDGFWNLPRRFRNLRNENMRKILIVALMFGRDIVSLESAQHPRAAFVSGGEPW